MEETIRQRKIQSLKAQLEATRLRCESLSILYEAAMVSAEKTELARRLDEAMSEQRAVHGALVVLEKEEREAPPDADLEPETHS